MISFISPVARVCMNAMVSEDRSQDISIALSVGYIERLEVIETFQPATT
jgi:hypothetical protein